MYDLELELLELLLDGFDDELLDELLLYDLELLELLELLDGFDDELWLLELELLELPLVLDDEL